MIFSERGKCTGFWPRLAYSIAGLTLFALGYGVANRFQLTHNVLYRFAAGDYQSAATAFFSLSIQAGALLAAFVLLSRRATGMLLMFVGISIAVNLGYSQLVQLPLTVGSFAWLLAETRQAQHAAGEFGSGLLFSGTQTVISVLLFIGARMIFGKAFSVRRRPLLTGAALLLMVLPSVMVRVLPVGPEAAERNIYGFGVDIARVPAPPARAEPDLELDPSKELPRHIVWIIDESVAYEPFGKVIRPNIKAIPHQDFGIAAALGNCSSPAHVALRSGVDVRRASARTDLRSTPSIWAYARRAGYHTRMIDGQATGAPQNMLLAPEHALIDEYRQMAGDLDTDLRIADAVNADLRKPDRSFTYVVLRGVHFQYRDHYPKGTVPDTAPVAAQYDAALTWSKRGFFDRLLKEVDRDAVAIVYTSDHGQNLKKGALPHCSRRPVADEFRVPLLAFLPDAIAARYAGSPVEGHSASQIFPATLIWMGFDKSAAEARYDHDLDRPSARYVWFGRKVVPLHEDDQIELAKGEAFPGAE